MVQGTEMALIDARQYADSSHPMLTFSWEPMLGNHDLRQMMMGSNGVSSAGSAG